MYGDDTTNPTPSEQSFPDDALIRLYDVLKLIPVSKSTWWQLVADGTVPRPVKIGSRCTAWRYSDIRRFMDGLGKEK